MTQNFDDIRRPSVWLAIPIVLVLITVWTNTDYPLDYWLHVNNGRWMVENGELITADTFSHTIEGQPVRNQAWLAQVVMYGLHSLGGYALNQFVAGLGYAAAVAGVVWIIARRCGNWTLAACGGVVTFALICTNLGVRPQYGSVVLFVVELWVLLYLRGRILVPAICFLILSIWTNVHGAFPVGVVLPAIMLGAGCFDQHYNGQFRHLTRLAAATLAALAGCFVRPFPGETIQYVRNVSSQSVARGLEEWLPTSWQLPSGMIFFGSVLLLLFVFGASRRRATLLECLLLAAFFLLAVTSQRMLLWWAIVMPVAVTRPADHIWRRIAKSRRRDNRPHANAVLDRWVLRVLGPLTVVFVCFLTPWTRSYNRLLPPIKQFSAPYDEPREMVERFVGIQRPIRSFAPLPWGSYLSWHSHGQMKSFLDTRVDFFPDDVWQAFLQIRGGGPYALELLDAFEIEVVVCGPDESNLEHSLNNSLDWHATYDDDLSTVFERTEI